jgi:hypothetical protein
MSYRFADCLRAHIIAVRTVKNSRWWREELSETCRVTFQNKCQKSVHLLGFIIRNLSRCMVYKNVKYIMGCTSFGTGTCGTFNTGLSNIPVTQLTIPCTVNTFTTVYTTVPLILATAYWTDGGHILLSFSYGVIFWSWKWQHCPR